MNYVEYTEDAIKKHSTTSFRVLVVGAGYNVESLWKRSNRTVISTGNKDLAEWCEDYRDPNRLTWPKRGDETYE